MRTKFYLLLIALVTAIGSVWGQSFMSDGVNYRVQPDNSVIVVLTNYSGALTIPPTVTNGGTVYAVKSIEASAFAQNYNLTSVVVSEGIETIGQSAFANCKNLLEATLPSTLTEIPRSLFATNLKLKKVTLAEGITAMRVSAFAGNEALESLSIPSSISVIDAGTFRDTPNLSITLSGSNFHFENGALYNSGKTEILYYQYARPNTSFEILSTVTNFGMYVFYSAVNIQSFTVEDGSVSFVERDGVLYTLNATNRQLRICPAGTLITDLVIPTDLNVKTTSNYAFWNCKNLESISFPSSMTSITIGNTFRDCINLRHFLLPDGHSIYSVDSDGVMFSNNGETLYLYPAGKRDENYTVPSNVKVVGASSFGNHYLKNVILPEGVESIGNTAFYAMLGLESVTIPSSLTTLGTDVFSGCVSLSDVVFTNPGSSQLNSIPSGTFYLTALKTIELPESITTIGNGAFQDTKIEEIVFPSNLETIGNNAFLNTDLKNIIIPDNVVSIGNGAFQGNSHLDEVVISSTSNLETLGDNAFLNTDLKNIMIPESVENIGHDAFKGNSNLSEITFEGDTPPANIGEGAFSDISEDAKVIVPKGSEDNYIELAEDGVVPVSPDDIYVAAEVEVKTDPDKPLVFIDENGKTIEVLPGASTGEKYEVLPEDNEKQEINKIIITYPDGTKEEIEKDEDGKFKIELSGDMEIEVVVVNKKIVTFINDGTTTLQYVKDGERAIEPSVSRTGYTFNGWSNGSTSWNFATAVTADLTLTANWSAIPTFTVTVNSISGVNAGAGGTVYLNGTFSFRATATDGSSTVTVYANNSKLTPTSDNFYSISGITEDLVITFELTAGSNTTTPGEGENNGSEEGEGSEEEEDAKVVIDGSDPVIEGDFPSGGEIVLTPPLVTPGTNPSVTINGEDVIGTWTEDENGDPIYVIEFDGLDDGKHVLIVDNNEFEFTTDRSNDNSGSASKAGEIVIDENTPTALGEFPLSGEIFIYPSSYATRNLVAPTVTINGEAVTGAWSEDKSGDDVYVVEYKNLAAGNHTLVINGKEYTFTTSRNAGGATSNDVLSTATITASYGAITIDTPKQSTVYVVSLSGSVVYNAKVVGTVTVNVQAGLYIVVVDGVSTKVVVR